MEAQANALGLEVHRVEKPKILRLLKNYFSNSENLRVMPS